MKNAKILAVTPFQETLGGGYCGPASLKMILNYWGIEKTEEEVAKRCNRDPDLGTDDFSIKKAAETFGLSVEIINNSSFDSISHWLDQDIPVIVNWFTRGRSDYGDGEVSDGHYSVVVGLDEENIYLQDPETGGLRTLDKEDFFRVWFDFRPGFISEWSDMIIRQLIAIYPPKK